MTSPTARVALLSMFASLIGCDSMYLLPGHRQDGPIELPSLTMRVGERRKAIATGFELMTPGWKPVMWSADTAIAGIEVTDKGDTVYLHALSPGTTTVYYGPNIQLPNQDHRSITHTFSLTVK